MNERGEEGARGVYVGAGRGCLANPLTPAMLFSFVSCPVPFPFPIPIC